MAGLDDECDESVGERMNKAKDKAAKRDKTEVARLPDGKWAKGTPSPNPAGAPKRGQSWQEVIKEVSEMTADEVADWLKTSELASAFKQMPKGITLKKLIVTRVYSALMFEPTAPLLNSFMDRAEGKVTQPVSIDPDELLLEKLAQLGLTLDDIRNDPAASALFALTGSAVSIGSEAARTDSGDEAGE